MAVTKLKVNKPLTSWSYSRYSDWKECPYKFAKKHLLGFKEAPSAAMQRGTEIHLEAEKYLTKQLPKLPASLALFKVQMTDLRKHKPSVEQNWGFTNTWSPTQWNDWANCWLRVKLDAAVVRADAPDTLLVVDHKTGKYSDYKAEAYMEQQELYAVAGLHMYPHVQQVTPQLWFLDAGVTHPAEPVMYARKELPKLVKLWGKRVEPMFKDKTFAPRPGKHCTWCPHSKAKGGDCKY